jgi:hypothetical protein
VGGAALCIQNAAICGHVCPDVCTKLGGQYLRQAPAIKTRDKPASQAIP